MKEEIKGKDKNLQIKLCGVGNDNYNPTLPIERIVSGNKYISWGIDNRFPKYLYDLYCNCTVLRSIINGSIDYTLGDDIIIRFPSHIKKINSDKKTIKDVISKLIHDIWVYGGFALQLIPNNLGEIIEIVALDMRYIRVNKDMTKVYFSHKFCDTYNLTSGLLEYDIYNKNTFGRPDENGIIKSQVFYYNGNQHHNVYPICDYYSAITSCETQIEIQKFHYNEITNHLNASGILAIDGEADTTTEEGRDNLEAIIQKKFIGTDGQRVMVVTGTDKVNFTPIQSDNFDTRYTALEQSTIENIFISMRAIPVVFGMTVQTGFNTQEFEEAFKLYNRTAILPKQNIIVNIFEQLFDNGSIEFIPFNVDSNQTTINNIPQSLIDLIKDRDLKNNEKKGILKELYGLTDEQINNIIINE